MQLTLCPPALVQGGQRGKEKRQTAADSSDDDAPPAKRPKGGGGRGAGRKKASPVLGGVQTDLYGKRIAEKKQLSLADMIHQGSSRGLKEEAVQGTGGCQWWACMEALLHGGPPMAAHHS